MYVYDTANLFGRYSVWNDFVCQVYIYYSRVMRAIVCRQCSFSAADSIGVGRRWTPKMSARPPSSGRGTTTLRDNLPGRVRAGSNTCRQLNVHFVKYMLVWIDPCCSPECHTVFAEPACLDQSRTRTSGKAAGCCSRLTSSIQSWK